MVCSRDRAAFLREALIAVTAALRAPDELIVVDSASRDAAVGQVATEAGARVVRTDRPGLGHARNIGWQAAERSVVAFTDDDCAPAADWTARVEAAFADATVGIAFGQVVGEGGGAALSTKVSELARRVEPGGSTDGLGHGANLSVRRSALTAVGGFDDQLGAGGRFPAAEDSDLAWRLVRAGWAAVFDPTSVVTHRKWRGRGPALRVMYRYGVGAGAAAAKARRLGDSSHRIRHEIWDEGLRMAGRHVRTGYEFGAVACVARAAGAAIGAVRGRRLRVDDTGRYVE
ncbi:MAG TPA: glycosyltransferase [Mycobacteriales bacterium]|nr:glycosyltransferase [Mycobacteriales bacterium]